MKYVSEIIKNGRPVSYGSLMRLTGGGVKAFAYDPESGCYCPDAGSDCLGYDKALDVAVRYDAKSARLHDFVVSAETRRAADEGGEGFWRSISSFLDCPDERVELVAIPDEIITVHGVLGSVVRRLGADNGVVTFCTLFDLLVDLSMQVGSSLMTKEVLLIDSGIVHQRTVIELRHTKEAERFYMKMYMAGSVGK